MGYKHDLFWDMCIVENHNYILANSSSHAALNCQKNLRLLFFSLYDPNTGVYSRGGEEKYRIKIKRVDG